MRRFLEEKRTKKWYQYMVITLTAIIFSLVVQMFVIVAHIFTAGVSALALIPSFIWTDIAPYATAIYLALNVPLLIWAFMKKMKKAFLIKTTYFLVLQAGIGFIFAFPVISDKLSSLITDADQVLNDIWPIFVLALLAGIANGWAIGTTWRYGGSSGGGDIITHYYSTKYKKSVGGIGFIVSMAFSTIAIISTLIAVEERRATALDTTIGTILYVFVSSAIINTVFPKYSLIHVEIHSEKIKGISDMMKKKKYHHSWQTREVKSGFTGKKKEVLSTVMLLLEKKQFLKDVKEIDPKVWILISSARSVVGNFDTSIVE